MSPSSPPCYGYNTGCMCPECVVKVDRWRRNRSDRSRPEYLRCWDFALLVERRLGVNDVDYSWETQ